MSPAEPGHAGGSAGGGVEAASVRLEDEFVGSWPPTSFMGFPRPGLMAPAMLDPEDLPAPSGLHRNTECGRDGRRSSAHFSPGSRGRAEDLGDLADPLLGGRSASQESDEGDSPLTTGLETGSFASAGNSAGSLAGPKLARLKPPGEPGRSLTNSPSFKPAAVAQHSAAVAHGALYGTICAIVNLPSLVSFTGIVFFAPVFFAKMPQLVKMFYLASAIQQAVFVLVGTLPFAVGQVQDVGLIILSSMAQSIASRCAADGVGEAKMLTTTLLFLAFSTICVGLCVGLASKVGISRYLQQVPLPVIGGYLGFVGYFCFAAGATLATDRHVSSLASWEAVMNRHDLVHFAPCLGSMVLYFASTRLSKHPLTFPSVMVLVPVLFFLVLLLTGTSLEEARRTGWIFKAADPAPPFWQIWGDLYAIDFSSFRTVLHSIHWPALNANYVKILVLVVIVGFGSSLDIAAIQFGSSDEVDSEQELLTVGLANLVAGLAGTGFTGSYIFTLTLFNMKNKVSSKAQGIVIVAFEVAFFMLPFSLMDYLPKFFFASFLVYCGVEIMYEWLILSIKKVGYGEFTFLQLTFLACLFFGLEAGIGIGIVLAALYFIACYSMASGSSVISLRPSRSTHLRYGREQYAMQVLRHNMRAVHIHGYVFFGSALSVGDKIQAALKDLYASSHSVISAVISSHDLDMYTAAKATMVHAPVYFILDFTHCTGLDATAAFQLGALRARLADQGVHLLVCNVPLRSKGISRLLRIHRFLPQVKLNDEVIAEGNFFKSMYHAVEFCEKNLLEIAGRNNLIPEPVVSITLADFMAEKLQGCPLPYKKRTDFERELIGEYMLPERLGKGESVFRHGEPADAFYLILKGKIRCFYPATDTNDEYTYVVYNPGQYVGDLDFSLDRNRSFSATVEDDCQVLALGRDRYAELAKKEPELFALLQYTLLATCQLSAAHALVLLTQAATTKKALEDKNL